MDTSVHEPLKNVEKANLEDDFWIDYNELYDVTKALIDKDKYVKIFREQKLERVLNEEEK